MKLARLGVVFVLSGALSAGLAQGCGPATFTVQQYDGPVRSREAIAVLRVNGKEPVQLQTLDGEDAAVRVPEDARLHIEILPGKHTIGVVSEFDTHRLPLEVAFNAEPGKVYRPVLVQERRQNYYGARLDVPRVYEVDAESDALLRDVTLVDAPPAPPPPPEPAPSAPEPPPAPEPTPAEPAPDPDAGAAPESDAGPSDASVTDAGPG